MKAELKTYVPKPHDAMRRTEPQTLVRLTMTIQEAADLRGLVGEFDMTRTVDSDVFWALNEIPEVKAESNKRSYTILGEDGYSHQPYTLEWETK